MAARTVNARARRAGLSRRAVGGAFLVLALGTGSAGAAAAEGAPGCMIVADVATGALVAREGACAERHSPASTFKVALSLIGFDRGILTGPHAPVWNPPADPGRVKTPTDPTSWLDLSVVWYSQHLVRELGAARYAEDVARLGYGNVDVSGDPGTGNGMERAWIDSSLRISPTEQVAFIAAMLRHELPVSDVAISGTRAIMPSFDAPGMVVRGKTGAAWHRDARGVAQPSDALAWFVGWAETDDGRTFAFARFAEGPAGGTPRPPIRLRADVLKRLPQLIGPGAE